MSIDNVLLTHPGGVRWTMDKDMAATVPLRWKIAANTLGKQFFRVAVTDWRPDFDYDHEDAELFVKVWRDTDTLNPTSYVIVMDNSVVGRMVRREDRQGGHRWPIFKATTKPEPPVRAIPRRPNRPRLAVAPIIEDKLTDRVHSIFCERAELRDELRTREVKFERNPTDGGNLGHIIRLRREMCDVEQRIMMTALTEGMMAQAMRDIEA